MKEKRQNGKPANVLYLLFAVALTIVCLSNMSWNVDSVANCIFGLLCCSVLFKAGWPVAGESDEDIPGFVPEDQPARRSNVLR